MGLIIHPRSVATIKPGAIAGINRAHPLAQGLSNVLIPTFSNRERDLISGSLTSPLTTAATLEGTSRFGVGWRNDATSNKGVATGEASGYCKGQTYFSFACLVRLIATPSAAQNIPLFQECVANSVSSTRLGLFITNGSLGSTGIKWDVTFRTGTSASTARNVNAGAGGTTAVAGGEYAIVFTFDSVADVYNLYINGYLEATLSVSESAIANTDPNSTGTFLNGTAVGSSTNAILSAFYFWKGRVLSAAEAAQINADPYALLAQRPRKLYVSVGGQALTLNISDSITMSDARTSNAGCNKSDALTMSDTRTSNAGCNKSDAISCTDAKVVSVAKVLADSIALSDTKALALLKVLADSISCGDALAKAIAKAMVETIGASDSLSQSFAKILSDSISLGDTASIVLTLLFSDSISLSDTATRSPGKVLVDTVALDDALLKSVSKAFADAITADDSAAKECLRSIADAITIGDAQALTFGKAIVEAIAASDSTSFEFAKVLSDLLSAADEMEHDGSGAILNAIEAILGLRCESSMFGVKLVNRPTAADFESKPRKVTFD